MFNTTTKPFLIKPIFQLWVIQKHSSQTKTTRRMKIQPLDNMSIEVIIAKCISLLFKFFVVVLVILYEFEILTCILFLMTSHHF